MSPVLVPGKKPVVRTVKPPSEEGGLNPAGRKWVLLGLAMVCVWLLVTGLFRLLGNTSPVSANAPNAPNVTAATSVHLPEQPPEVPAPAPPVERTMMHYEAVQATMESLRKHSRENPDAPDALSEERIKALEKQGALIL